MRRSSTNSILFYIQNSTRDMRSFRFYALNIRNGTTLSRQPNDEKNPQFSDELRHVTSLYAITCQHQQQHVIQKPARGMTCVCLYQMGMLILLTRKKCLISLLWEQPHFKVSCFLCPSFSRHFSQLKYAPTQYKKY